MRYYRNHNEPGVTLHIVKCACRWRYRFSTGIRGRKKCNHWLGALEDISWVFKHSRHVKDSGGALIVKQV